MEKQIIGIDISTQRDKTAIDSFCTGCKRIIEFKKYDPEVQECGLTIFTECPFCGVKFSNHIIKEE